MIASKISFGVSGKANFEKAVSERCSMDSSSCLHLCSENITLMSLDYK